MVNSILRQDSSLDKDHELIEFLLEKTLAWDKEHKKLCLEKIMNNIITLKRQKKYYVRSYIFCMYYGLNIKIIDIATMLFAQAMEVLYILECWPKTKRFDTKFEFLFKKYYWTVSNHDTANILRIIRNNIAHATLVQWLDDKNKEPDKKSIQNFREKYWFSDDHKALYALSFSFDLLMREIILRSLGLDKEDFLYNLSPPSKNTFFV